MRMWATALRLVPTIKKSLCHTREYVGHSTNTYTLRVHLQVDFTPYASPMLQLILPTSANPTGGIEMCTEISLYIRSYKAIVKHSKIHWDNTGTWHKTSSGRSNRITTSDSDHAYHIYFMWAIVFFTQASR